MKQTIITCSLQNLILAGAMVMALPQTAAALDKLIPPPSVPANLEVPAGNKVYLKGYAVGTQNYICLPTGWTFIGPQATLFLRFQSYGSEIRQQITTHFLSPNPDEGGTPRATWQSSLDTSAVWARAIETSSDPAYVAPGAIPWLKLTVVGSERGRLLSGKEIRSKEARSKKGEGDG